MLRHLSLRLTGVLVAIAAVSTAGFAMQRASAAPAATQPASKAALLFNLTSGTSGNGVHAVSMGLGLASSAAKEGHEVVVSMQRSWHPRTFPRTSRWQTFRPSSNSWRM